MRPAHDTFTGAVAWREAMPLPDFLVPDLAPGQPRRTLSVRETEQFLLLATYHLWREDAPRVDGAALDRLRGALSPHGTRDRNKQFSVNVLDMALDRLMAAGLIEIAGKSLRPSARAVDELERAMAETRTTTTELMRRILED